MPSSRSNHRILFLFRGLPSVPNLYLVKDKRRELGDGHRIHGRDLLQLISLQPFATGWGSIPIELSARTAKPGDATGKYFAKAPRFCCLPRRNHLLVFGEGGYQLGLGPPQTTRLKDGEQMTSPEFSSLVPCS